MKKKYALSVAVAAVVALGSVPAIADADVNPYRQLIGTVSAPTFLEASTPKAGSYEIEYEITGVAFFDTYVDGTELGYVGGVDGAYRTEAVDLTAGGHLIQVVGPDGVGTAKVYLVAS